MAGQATLGMGPMPAVDGVTLPHDPVALLAGKVNTNASNLSLGKVALLVGCDSNESTLFTADLPEYQNVTAESFRELAASLLPSRAPQDSLRRLLALYAKDGALSKQVVLG